MPSRRAGVLLHPTSLLAPDRPPEAALDQVADDFLRWAQAAGLSLWQMLPVGPPDEYGSPYSSLSLFAGDPGWIARGASEGLRDTAVPAERRHTDSARSYWLDDWALFAALRDHYGTGWWCWPECLARRDPKALKACRRELEAEVQQHLLDQTVFDRRWLSLRAGATRRGIELLGDLPFYPAWDSADVWAHPELFDLDPSGRPRRVAGVPPDRFSETGQHWGNPVYRWDRMAEDGFQWWIERFRTQLGRFDQLRLDHFRGLAAFWAVPADAETAAAGEWVPGPGEALLEALQSVTLQQGTGEALNDVLVAEDLGVITPDVTALRRRFSLPGIRVLQFAFDGNSGDIKDDSAKGSEPLPAHHEADSVVYTGTHDNDTTAGWLQTLDPESRDRVRAAGGDPRDPWSLIEMAYASPARTVVIPLQDLLGLGSEARMNTPGVAKGNWGWRLDPELLTPQLAERARQLAQDTGRLPS